MQWFEKTPMHGLTMSASYLEWFLGTSIDLGQGLMPKQHHRRGRRVSKLLMV